MKKIALLVVAAVALYGLFPNVASAQTTVLTYSPIAAPTPVVTYSNPTTVYYGPSTYTTYYAPSPTVVQYAPAPVVAYSPVTPVYTYRPAYTGWTTAYYPVRRGLFGRRVVYYPGVVPVVYP